MLQIEAIPALKDNYIWAVIRNSACALVDPGEAAPILAWMTRTGTRPCAILLTHHHGDHVAGVGALVEQFHIPVYGPAKEAIPGVDHPVQDGDRIALPGLDTRFEVIAVPGHTRGHIAWYGHGLLFCGDTLFGAGCGRLFEGTPEQMHASLTRLAGLPDNTQVCCAHEYTLANLDFALSIEPDNPALQARTEHDRAKRQRGEPSLPSDIALERATNPFLRCGQDTVRKAAEAWSGRPLTRPETVFAVVREMKNQF